MMNKVHIPNTFNPELPLVNLSTSGPSLDDLSPLHVASADIDM